MAYDLLICQAVLASLPNLSSSSHICLFTHTPTSAGAYKPTHTQNTHAYILFLPLSPFGCQTLRLFYRRVKLLWIEPDGRQRTATDVWPRYLYVSTVDARMCVCVFAIKRVLIDVCVWVFAWRQSKWGWVSPISPSD